MAELKAVVDVPGLRAQTSQLRTRPDASLTLMAEDAQATFGVDYSAPDRVTLTLDGHYRILDNEGVELWAHGGVQHQVLQSNTTFHGTLTLEVDPNTRFEVWGKHHGDGPTEAGAVLTLRF